MRSLLVRLLHPLRRRAALRSLARRQPPRSVLFVCHGNIYRSSYAAMAFSRRLPTSLGYLVRADSAGFVGPGRPAPPKAIEVAARRGVDLSAHRSKLVMTSSAVRADLVVVMEPGQGRALQELLGWNGRAVLALGDLDPEPVATRTILDPVDQPETALEATYARIDRCIDALVAAAFQGRRPLEPARAARHQ